MSESDLHEGDLVEAVKGETVIRGRLRVPVIDNPEAGLFWIGDSGSLLKGMFTLGFTVTRIERAKPALPTANGLYRSATGGLWQINSERGLISVTNPSMCEDATEFAPFTRLEPVAETAARFAARLHTVVQPKIDSSWYTKTTARKILEQADAIAAEFGVTGELGE